MTNLNLMFLFFFHFLRSYVPDSECHKQKWRVLFLICIKLVARVLACARAIARMKWRRLLDQENMYLFVYNMDILLGYPKQNTL